MSTIHRWDDTHYIVLTKGSYSDTIKQCDRIQVNGKIRPMTKADRLRTKKANADYASRGLRSMALAYKIIDHDVDFNKINIADAESDLVFVDLATMSEIHHVQKFMMLLNVVIKQKLE